jgi:transcriptional regulator with XRE-family HTH domain
MDIALRIKQLFEKRKDLEQKDLANLLGISTKTAHNYLNGHSKIIADHIPAIAKLLRVSISELYGIGNELKSKNDIDSCLECIKKQLEIDELKNKNIELNEKYIACLEELLGKKGKPIKNSA